MIRITQLLRHLPSKKGVGLASAAALGVTALFLDAPLSQVFGALAILLAAGVLLAMSALASANASREQRGLHLESATSAPVAADSTAESADSQQVAVERAAAALWRLGTSHNAALEHAPGGEVAEHDHPLVTVVIPCFNEERFVADAIKSVMAQTMGDWECIVVDDASTDGTPRIANALAAGDDRIEVVRHRVNGGLSAARNTGLRLARGRYTTFLDGDDMLTSLSLEDRVAALASVTGTEVVGSYCGVRLAPEGVALEELRPSYSWRDRGRIDFIAARGECPFNAHSPLTRTDVLRLLGGFSESMQDGAEDWDMWLRVMRAGFVWVQASSTTAIYRQKQGSMVREKLERHVELSAELLDRAYERLDPAMLPVVTAEAFTEPLPVYQKTVRRGTRVLRSAAMALIAGDEACADALVAELRGMRRSTIDLHISVDRAAAAATRRMFGLDSAELRGLANEITHLRSRVTALLDQHVPHQDDELTIRSGPSADVVAVPANAAQARAMLSVANRSSLSSWVFVNVARTSGDQGVAEVLGAAEVVVLSLNEWVLQRWTAARVVVASPRLAVVEEFVREAGEALVIDLATDGVDIMTVEGALPRTKHLTATSDELPNILGEYHPTAPTRPWRMQARTPETAWQLEEYPATRPDLERIADLKDVHKGERLCIIGNGPSLNELDLTLLRDEATVGVNGIFYKTDEVGIDLLYYVVEDTAVMADNLDRIRDYGVRGHRFFPSIYRGKVGERDDTTFFTMNRGFYAPESPNYCVPRFSTDLRQRVFTGQSVTIINLQLAYWMGFTEVVLIGMDFSYTIPDDAEVEGDIITSQSDDPNHFHPDYFGKGKVWKDPKLDRVLANYQLAKLMFEQDGRRIVNATAGGKLELFERRKFTSIYG